MDLFGKPKVKPPEVEAVPTAQPSSDLFGGSPIQVPPVPEAVQKAVEAAVGFAARMTATYKTDGSVPPGSKYDGEKLRLSLFPWGAVESVTRVLEYGAKKYAPHNWRGVEDGEARYYEAFLRHSLKASEGEYLDPESGLPHADHAACCLLFHITLREERKAREAKP